MGFWKLETGRGKSGFRVKDFESWCVETHRCVAPVNQAWQVSQHMCFVCQAFLRGINFDLKLDMLVCCIQRLPSSPSAEAANQYNVSVLKRRGQGKILCVSGRAACPCPSHSIQALRRFRAGSLIMSWEFDTTWPRVSHSQNGVLTPVQLCGVH